MANSASWIGNTPVPLFVTLVLALAGCGQPAESEPAVRQAESSASASAPAAENSPGSSRDISKLDVCAVVTGEEVAEVLGLAAETITATATRRPGFSDCTYSVQVDEDLRNYLMIWVYPPQMWYPEEDDVIESLDLGDAAYSSTMSTLAQVMVLAKDEFVLDVRADDADQARALAELAFRRLKAAD